MGWGVEGRRRAAARVAWALLALAAPHSAWAEDPGPLSQIDRAFVTGAPVLDAKAAEGVYLWLEDGWYHLAAASNLPFGAKKKRSKTFRVHLTATEDCTAELGTFKRLGKGERSLELQVKVGPHPEIARFQTEGTVTVWWAKTAAGDRLPIFVGPRARLAAPGVRVGRF